MAASTKKNSGGIKVGSFASDPSDTDAGIIYFNTASNILKYKTSTTYTPVLSSVVGDTAPMLGGNLDVNGNNIVGSVSNITLAPSSFILRGTYADQTDCIEEQYIHNTSLLASQTNTAITAFNLNFSVYGSCLIEYQLTDSTGAKRMGILLLITDGTNVSITDSISVQTATVNISFSTVIAGGSAEVLYTSSTATATLRADIKRFRV